MAKQRRVVLPALVVFLALVAGVRSGPRSVPVRANGAIQISGTPSVQNKFPAEVDFSIDATSSAGDITDVELHYQLLPTGNEATARAQFDKGSTVHAVYQLRTAGNPLYVPPTKRLSYYWTLQDAAGNQTKTDPVEWMYTDTRFPFKTASNGNLTIYYYSGSDANAQNLINVGRAALDKAGALDGAPIDFPVHLVVYRTQNDVIAALSHEAKSVDPNILGQANPPDIVVLVAGDLTGSENEDTVRHELTHLVNARAVQGPYSDEFPIWLDEGLAVFAQNEPTGFDSAVAAAIRQNAVVPVRSLTPGMRGEQPGLFYGESWSIVNFLVKTYGNAKMASLLAAFKAGSTEDQAFSQVYGMDRNGLYNAWRKSVGLSPVAVSAPSQAASAAANNGSSTNVSPPIPTEQTGVGAATAPTQAAPAPSGSSANVKQKSSSNGTDPAVVVALAVGGTALLLAIVAGAVIGGLALSRRSRV